jgi:VCBS repeat-containing protein
MRSSRILGFLVTVILSYVFWMGNIASIQAQPIIWEVSFSTSKQMAAETDGQQLIRASVLSATNHLTPTRTLEQNSQVDADGNGYIDATFQPNRIIETQTATLVNSCDSPVSGNDGLTWDGNYLWIADWDTESAYKVDPSSCLSVFSIPLPGPYPFGLAWDGSYLWHSDKTNKTIYQLDPSNGSVISSFSAPGGEPTGLAWENGDIWNADRIPPKIYKLTTAGNVLVSFSAASTRPTGLAYDGQNLWLSDNDSDTIYKLNPSNLSILDSFPSPGPYPNELAWDGQYLWIVDNGTDMLYQYDVGQSSLEADLGFRPNPDGYDFDNYGGNFPWGSYDFGYDELIRMFGQDDVCWMVGSVCLVKPSADWWHFQANRAMNGGHCDGMASTSLRFFKGLDNPSDFQNGANTTHDLQLNNTRRHIAYYFVEQLTDPVRAYKQQIRQNSPSVILGQLSAAMSGSASDPTTLFVRQAGQGGHAITPYAIEDKGNDVYWVKVYDNNHRNDANRHVAITTTTNTWSYDLGWATWSGDANTNSLGIVPISRYAEQPVCPWCSSTSTSVSATEVQAEQVWLTGQGHLLITDSQGRRIGYAANQFVNEVPGAYESIIDNGLGVEQEPIYTLPFTGSYSILLDGQTLAQTNIVTLTQFGPGYATTLSNLALSSTSQDLLMIAADGKELSYQPNSDKEATLTLALDSSNKSNQFQIEGVDIGAGQNISVTVSGTELIFDNSQASGGTYDLEIVQVNTTGKRMFIHSGLIISATDTHLFDYEGFESTDVVTLTIDHGSNGTIDETEVLENQVRRVYLPLIMK